MKGLVGHTGFVGGNLARQMAFDRTFASRTIDEIAGQHFDLLVVSAVPAAMWVANNQPERDMANIQSLYERLAMAEADQVVLISTIAVYADPAAKPDEEGGVYESEKAYGRHRRRFEEMLAERFARLTILRLPALFGQGLSKNFIFDLLNPLPSFLNPDAHARLLEGAGEAERAAAGRAYAPDSATGFMKLDRAGVAPEDAALLEDAARRRGLDASHFTNSDSRFQFYNLDHLSRDMERAVSNRFPALNLATEPLVAGDVAQALTGQAYRDENPARVEQDMRSAHSHFWSRDDGYLYGAEQVLDDLKRFYVASREGAA